MFTVLDKAYISASTRLNKKFDDFCAKSDGDSQLVVALVLIAVAVGLCVIFQKQIKNILDNLLATVKDKVNTLVNAT